MNEEEAKAIEFLDTIDILKEMPDDLIEVHELMRILDDKYPDKDLFDWLSEFDFYEYLSNRYSWHDELSYWESTVYRIEKK